MLAHSILSAGHCYGMLVLGVQICPLLMKAEQVPGGGDSGTFTGCVHNTGRGWLDKILPSEPSSQAL